MPHCIVEYSADLKEQPLMTAVFDGTLKSGLFSHDGVDIKVRALPFKHHITGDTQASFIHVVLKILAGRTSEQKQRLSDSVLQHILSNNYADCSVTVEVLDIDTPCYAKALV
ncbi:5-carboxymethyl-2-hydroxymuconate Delta-isomerase [Planctobacterium marinum]|uniref:5-carboxymethyl-2-hydroxymuconate isomerase n=1 Tax=Planctobacterium marinum TaxID=1631968 RepID=A0AA48KQ51_9ALTE|nr:hypothetical protein MACH26_02330 [Planctobacterium marinum]